MLSCRIAWTSVSLSTNSRGSAPGSDLEALDAQALDAVGRRDDAAVERQVVALPRQLRLQVAERALDLPVGVAVEPARHLELARPCAFSRLFSALEPLGLGLASCAPLERVRRGIVARRHAGRGCRRTSRRARRAAARRRAPRASGEPRPRRPAAAVRPGHVRASRRSASTCIAAPPARQPAPPARRRLRARSSSSVHQSGRGGGPSRERLLARVPAARARTRRA